jgi:tRNA G18 (ribose-2'-O)-methylase SpoU
MSRPDRLYRDQDFEQWCGVGIENYKLVNNVGVIFRTAAVLGGVDFLYTVGERYNRPHDDTVESFRSLPIWNFNSFRDLLDRLPLGCELVGVEMDKRSVALPDFEWPNRSVILFGAEGEGLSREARESCRKLIYIPSKMKVSMNVSSCASMVLYDRWLKMRNKYGKQNSNQEMHMQT